MHNARNRNFLTEVAQNNIPGYSVVHKFGRNDAVPNGVWELVSLHGGSGVFRSSPSTVRIKAGGNAADTADGDGAREITVIGLDSNLVEVSENIVTSGALASSVTVASFWRVYRTYVSTVGIYGDTNADDIVIEDSSGNADIITIAQDEGQSQHGSYSIPIGKTGYLLSVHLTSDSNKAADFRLKTRENLTDISAPISPRRVRLFWEGVLGDIDPYNPGSPAVVLPALTDIWIEAEGTSSLTEVSIDFEILLVDDLDPDIRQI